MHEDYEYVKSLEKEVDELESEKADFSNIYDLLLEECVSKDNKDAKSHKTTKRYMPVEKSSESKKPERQIPTGHRCTIQWKSRKISECGLLKLLILRKPMPDNGFTKDELHQMASAENNIFRPRSSMFTRRLITADQAQVFMAMIHKVVRLGINPMIQPEPEDLPKDNPKLEIAVLRWAKLQASDKHPSDTNVFTMKMEILLEPASNKLLVGDLRHNMENVGKRHKIGKMANKDKDKDKGSKSDRKLSKETRLYTKEQEKTKTTCA
ncbi:hypothetical protein Tco_0623368 [Tanacetum coccineum]